MTCFDISKIKYINEFKQLNFPINKYAFMNSAWMSALDIRDNNDLDVIVISNFRQKAVDACKSYKNISIMNGVHWDHHKATGINNPDEFIKKHSIIIEGIRILRFDSYIKMLNIRAQSSTRFVEKATIDLNSLKHYSVLNSVPVLK